MRSRTYAGARPKKAPDSTMQPRAVSKPNDKLEREAEQAAQVVARGGSVSSFSFSSVSTSAPDPVQRDDTATKPKSEDEKKKEADDKNKKDALKKAGEAALETPQGKAVKEKVLADPLVKTVVDAVTSPAGLATAGAALAGGVTALAVTGKELPVQPPDIPLEKLSSKLAGVSAQVTWEGPVGRPTNVGLTITIKEQGKKKKGKAPDPIAADTARLKAQQEMFRSEGDKATEKAQEDEMVKAWLSQQRGSAFTIPVPAPPPKKDEFSPTVSPAPASPSAAPPEHAVVDDALAAPGHPLDPSTRRAMEARFGYDFSGVRVHDDARAAATAEGIDAAAFTVGEDVVFGPGRFDPSGAEGRRLLAHELAHVVQQSRGHDAAGTTVHRRSIFESLGILLGIEEGTWEDSELHAYLDAITASGRIEGAYDSDNKARAIVARWKAATRGFDLLPPQKVLLIREMLDGPTLGEDEMAILDLLELSDASDLRAIFRPDGIALPSFESDIDGDNRTRLDAFVASRFDGGRDAVLAGRVEILGNAVPAGAPRFGFDAATLDARFDSDRSVEDLIALVEAMPDADRTQALHHLVAVRRPRQLALVDRVRREYAAEHDATRRLSIQETGRRFRREMLKTERVILHFFRDAVPTTAADLEHDTSPTDPARAAALREALAPPRGAAATFRSTLPGETQSYEDKIRAHLPTLVDGYYQHLVVGHGPAEHRDPAQTHTLAEFEGIGNAAKDETDAVFGRFYAPAAHPPLRADRPRRRGNVHDQFAETERQLRRMTRDQRRDMAKTLIFYFFQSDDWARRLNHDHDAAPRFDRRERPLNDEAIAIDAVATEFVRDRANVTRLNEIDRNWEATAQPETREIFFQLFRAPTPEADRLLLWDVFQTFIHEYTHTLVHDAYHAYAHSFGDNSNEYNTLIEGVDSLLTEVVWTAIEARVTDPTLRTRVEGPTIAALPPINVPHASQRRYPSYTEALRLSDLAGIQNIYAAYFLGLVDRIGGPPAPASGAGP